MKQHSAALSYTRLSNAQWKKIAPLIVCNPNTIPLVYDGEANLCMGWRTATDIILEHLFTHGPKKRHPLRIRRSVRLVKRRFKIMIRTREFDRVLHVLIHGTRVS